MNSQRRDFLKAAALGTAGLALTSPTEFFAAEPRAAMADDLADLALPPFPIIDTHQHLWSVTKMVPPWLENAGPVLKQEYLSKQYDAATEGLDISAIYMDVDMAPENLVAEAELILKLIEKPNSVTRAAIIGGRPADPGFAGYLDRFADKPAVKGVRQVLHGSTPRGFCLQESFVAGMRELGKRNMSFDFCMRPQDLVDVEQLVRQVPETTFILDHCGNPDVTAFHAGASSKSHDPDQWKRDMEKLAKFENLDCKISGVIAKAPVGWKPQDFAPVVNHCLDTFGPKRVVFGGDWPVCLLGASFKQWVAALHEIIAVRPESEQKALWSENAKRVYRL